jgi:hypothetical protein
VNELQQQQNNKGCAKNASKPLSNASNDKASLFFLV